MQIRGHYAVLRFNLCSVLSFTLSPTHTLSFKCVQLKQKCSMCLGEPKEPEGLTKRHASSPMLYPAQLQVAALTARGTTAVQFDRNTSSTQAWKKKKDASKVLKKLWKHMESSYRSIKKHWCFELVVNPACIVVTTLHGHRHGCSFRSPERKQMNNNKAQKMQYLDLSVIFLACCQRNAIPKVESSILRLSQCLVDARSRDVQKIRHNAIYSASSARI